VRAIAADQAQFMGLPFRASAYAPAISHANVMPFESLQHPLSAYDALLGSASFSGSLDTSMCIMGASVRG
jgi:hypothetical protein